MRPRGVFLSLCIGLLFAPLVAGAYLAWRMPLPACEGWAPYAIVSCAREHCGRGFYVASRCGDNCPVLPAYQTISSPALAFYPRMLATLHAAEGVFKVFHRMECLEQALAQGQDPGAANFEVLPFPSPAAQGGGRPVEDQRCVFVVQRVSGAGSRYLVEYFMHLLLALKASRASC